MPTRSLPSANLMIEPACPSSPSMVALADKTRDRPHGYPVQGHVDEKDAEPFLALAACTGEQEAVVGKCGVGCPDLRAIDDEAVAVPLGGCAQRKQIGAGRRFR